MPFLIKTQRALPRHAPAPIVFSFFTSGHGSGPVSTTAILFPAKEERFFMEGQFCRKQNWDPSAGREPKAVGQDGPSQCTLWYMTVIKKRSDAGRGQKGRGANRP